MTVKLKKIDIIRVHGTEGVDDLAKRTFTDYGSVNRWVKKMAKTAPLYGSFHRVVFCVYFEDGKTYKGHIELKHEHTMGYHVGAHVREFWSFYAGTLKPAHMSERQYSLYLKVNKEICLQAQKNLAAYDLDDYPDDEITVNERPIPKELRSA